MKFLLGFTLWRDESTVEPSSSIAFPNTQTLHMREHARTISMARAPTEVVHHDMPTPCGGQTCTCTYMSHVYAYVCVVYFHVNQQAFTKSHPANTCLSGASGLCFVSAYQPSVAGDMQDSRGQAKRLFEALTCLTQQNLC